MKPEIRIAVVLGICAVIATWVYVTTDWEEPAPDANGTFVCSDWNDIPKGLPVSYDPDVNGYVTQKEFTFEDLLDAIEWVESKGDANAMGDNGAAIGAYQIHKIYVDDVNRIRLINAGGEKKLCLTYNYEDRWSKRLSRGMVATYLLYYEGQTPTDLGRYPFGNMSWQERLARIHNGGPDGWKKESTKPYWEKVKARMYETRKAWDEYTFNQYANRKEE